MLRYQSCQNDIRRVNTWLAYRRAESGGREQDVPDSPVNGGDGPSGNKD